MLPASHQPVHAIDIALDIVAILIPVATDEACLVRASAKLSGV
jgi:hypothetical protein